MARTLPIALLIVIGIVVAVFPLFVIAMSFAGLVALRSAANYSMGIFALMFNMVSLAIVQNVISFYTGQHAQEAISSLAEMPYGISNVTDFMMMQADMAGIAGLVGVASIFAVTPLVFKGEMSGFNAAVGAVNGAFSGNIDRTAKDTLTQADLEHQVDASTATTMTEKEAEQRLSELGIPAPTNMSALQTYSDIVKGAGMIGAGKANTSLYHGTNAGGATLEDYQAGSQVMTAQSIGKTAGVGSTASIESAEITSMQDGQVMGHSINATDRLRNMDETTGERNNGNNWNAEDVGTGMAAQQFSREKGLEHTGSKINSDWASNDKTMMANQVAKEKANQSSPEYDINEIGRGDYSSMSKKPAETIEGKGSDTVAALVANSTYQAASQIAAGQGLIDTGAFNADGTISPDNETMNNALHGVETQSAQKLMETAGMGKVVDIDKAMSVSEENGEISGHTTNKTFDRREDLKRKGTRDEIGWDAEKIGSGNAISQVHKETTSQGVHNSLEKEKGDLSEAFIKASHGSEEAGRKSENTTLGVGKEWAKKKDAEQIKTMSKVQENAAVQEFGGIDATNAEIQKHAKNGGGDAVEGAIKDMVTGAEEKGTQSAVHSSQMRTKFGSHLQSVNKEGQNLLEEAQANKAEAEKYLASEEARGDDKKTEEKRRAMTKQFESADAIIKSNPQNMTFEDITGAIEGTKIASMTGQGVGAKINQDNDIDYARNATMGEMTKAQATQATIDTQGGVGNAVANDVTGAQEKATQTEVHAVKMRGEFGNNLDEKSLSANQTIQDSIDKELTDVGADKNTSIDEKKQKAKKLLAKKEELEEKGAMDFKDVSSNIEESKIQSMVGQAVGVKENLEQNPNMYTRNAEFSEESKQQGMSKTIDTQGGLENAVNTSVTDAGLKAKKQQEGLESEVEQYAKKQLKESNPDASEEEISKAAKEIGKAFVEEGGNFLNGLKDTISNEKINIDGISTEGIQSAAGSLAGAMAGGKTAHDLKTVQHAGGSEDYIESQSELGTKAGGQLAKSIEVAKNLDAKNKILNTNYKGAYALGHGEEFIEEAESLGFGKFNKDTGKFEATDSAEKWVAATGMASANNATMEDSWTIGGVSFSQKLDSHGDGIVTATSGKEEKVLATNADVKIAEDEAENNNTTADKIMDQVKENEADLSPVQIAKTKLAAKMTKEQEEAENFVPSEDNDGAITPSTFLNDYAPAALTTFAIAGEGLMALYGVDKAAKFFASEYKTASKEDLVKNGYTFNDDNTITDKQGNKVTEKNGKYYSGDDEIKVKNPKKKAGPAERGIERNKKKIRSIKDSIIEKFSPAPSATKQEFPSTSHDYQDTIDGSGFKSQEKDGFHNNPLNKFEEGKTPPTDTIIPDSDNAVNPVMEAKNNLSNVEKKIETLQNTPNSDVARERLKSIVGQHLDTAVSGSPEEAKLRELSSKLNGDGEIGQRDFKDTGIKPNELKENGIHMKQKSFFNKKAGKTQQASIVDMEGSGGYIKKDINSELMIDKVDAQSNILEAQEEAKASLEEQKKNYTEATPEGKTQGDINEGEEHKKPPHSENPTKTNPDKNDGPSKKTTTTDIPKGGSGRNRFIMSLASMAGLSLFTSSLNAKEPPMPTKPKPKQIPEADIPHDTSFLEDASNVSGLADLAVAITSLTAEGSGLAARGSAGVLTKSGISAGVKTLGTVAEGAGAVAKFGAKISPALGAAYAVADGGYRASQGDYLGAAMSGFIGAASSVPVAGTALSVLGAGAQILTDHYGITGTHNPAPQHQGFASKTTGGTTMKEMKANPPKVFSSNEIGYGKITSNGEVVKNNPLGSTSTVTSDKPAEQVVSTPTAEQSTGTASTSEPEKVEKSTQKVRKEITQDVETVITGTNESGAATTPLNTNADVSSSKAVASAGNNNSNPFVKSEPTTASATQSSSTGSSGGQTGVPAQGTQSAGISANRPLNNEGKFSQYNDNVAGNYKSDNALESKRIAESTSESIESMVDMLAEQYEEDKLNSSSNDVRPEDV